ncbi:MAG: hypothetical protein M3Y41_17630 [Pseudomonadota bacterium]|nr:hypothetical protein [Pseudomonadota bacterium]
MAANSEPTSVEEFVERAATREQPRKRVAVAESAAPLSAREAFEAKLRRATDPVDFTIPGQDVTVKLKALSIADRNECNEKAKRDDGTTDGYALACLYIEKGMVEPHYTAAEVAQMPEVITDPIYYKLMELTNGRPQPGARGADEPTPLVPTSGSGRFWQTVTTGGSPTS